MKEYAYLFDVDGPADELEAESWWREEQITARVGKMAYRTKTIKAGPRLEAHIYPIFGREDQKKARAARSQMTSEKMQVYNLERAREHLIRLADANFTAEDIHITLTYSSPPSFEQCRKDVKNYVAKVKRRRKREGLPELKYIYTIEDNESGRKKRIHVHMLMSGGISREELEAMWANGYANADRLQPDRSGLEAIARYITKAQKNRRKWAASRNLKQPSVRTSNTKISNRRVKRIALSIENEAKEITEKIYQGYDFVRCRVSYSEIVDGAYIRVLMRRRC